MTDLEPGILATRDATSHALQLGVFEPPAMPGSLNALTRDVSKRANLRAGTLAERNAAVAAGEVWKGLGWITLPDDPTSTNWTAQPVYWNGAGWSNPNVFRRGLYVPRSKQTTTPTNGILSKTITAVCGGTWENAPRGQYLIDFDFALDAAGSSAMTVQGYCSAGTMHADYEDTITPSNRMYHYHGFVENHTGGNLAAEVRVFLNDTTGTVFRDGTGVRFAYLGPAS